MAKLSSKDIRHVAKLAQLSLTSTEIKKFQKQLAQVVEYVSCLNEVKTEGIIPTSQTTGLENVFREDKITPLNQLALDGYFVVKQIINKK